MSVVDRQAREKLRQAAVEAFAGRLPWFDEIILDAGYVRPWYAVGIAQVAEFAQVSPSTIKKWWAKGCPGQEKTRGQDLSKLFAWMRNRQRTRIAGVDPSTALVAVV